MASLRGQLQRRAALRRAIPAKEVDTEEIRRFWLSLNTDLRQEFLCFDEASLVAKLHAHMTSLCKSEIWCRRNVLGGLLPRASSSAGTESNEVEERLRGFAFECPAERDCIGRQLGPISFCVLEEVAGRDDIFEELQRRLGTPFLQGRPALIEKDWHVVAEEKTPQNWKDLQVIAYRLVELAIFQAYKDAKDHAREREAARLQAQADEALAAELEGRSAAATGASSSTATKKKAKKNKGGKRDSEAGSKMDQTSGDLLQSPAAEEAVKIDDQSERRMSAETKASDSGAAAEGPEPEEDEATTHSGDDDDRKEADHEQPDEEEEEEEEPEGHRQNRPDSGDTTAGEQQQEQEQEPQQERTEVEEKARSRATDQHQDDASGQPSLRKTSTGLSGELSSRRWGTWLRSLSRQDGQWVFPDPSAVASSLMGQHKPQPQPQQQQQQQAPPQRSVSQQDHQLQPTQQRQQEQENQQQQQQQQSLDAAESPNARAPRSDASAGDPQIPTFKAVVKNTFLSLDFLNEEDKLEDSAAKARERQRRSCFF